MSLRPKWPASLPRSVWNYQAYQWTRDGLKKLALETMQKLEEAQYRVLTIMKYSGYRHLDLSDLPVVNLNSSVKLLKAQQAIGLNIESTDDRVISGLQHPVGQEIKEYRKHNKLLSKFLEKLPRYINPVTGKIHVDFNQQGTLAGRFSCRNPNLQQLPSDSSIRQLFRSNNVSTIITADYSQIELRILAEVSQEPKFIELFKNGGDLHKLTASLIFNKPLEKVSKEERYIAKSINFGLSYGIGAGGLQANLKENGIDIDKERADEYIRAFFRSYPRVSEYLDRAGTFAVEHSYIRNKAGRIIRYRPATDERERAAIARKGKNNPIQSLNVDITKLAMWRLYHRLRPFNARFINVVHDELVFEVPKEEAEEATEIIRDEMEAAGREYLTCVPVVVEISAGEAWEK